MEGRSRAAVDDTTSADSGDSGDEFLTPNSAADVYRKIDFGTPLDAQFSRIFREGATGDPKAAQREPKGAQGRPKASQKGPKAAPRRDTRSPMTSKRDQKEPNGVPEEPKGAPWHSKGSSKETYIHKNSRSTAPAAVIL